MYELMVEEEPFDENEDDTDTNRDTLFESDNDDDDQDLEQDDLHAMTGARGDTRKDAMIDDLFMRVGCAKDQCVRYHQWHDESPL